MPRRLHDTVRGRTPVLPAAASFAAAPTSTEPPPLQDRTRRFPSSVRAGIGALALTLGMVSGVWPAFAEETAANPDTIAPQTGMKVHVDPKTGKFLDTPAADPTNPGAASPRAAEPPPLVMEPSAIPGGGTGFRVPDQRFNSELKAVMQPGGGAEVDCGAAAK